MRWLSCCNCQVRRMLSDDERESWALGSSSVSGIAVTLLSLTGGSERLSLESGPQVLVDGLKASLYHRVTLASAHFCKDRRDTTTTRCCSVHTGLTLHPGPRALQRFNRQAAEHRSCIGFRALLSHGFRRSVTLSNLRYNNTVNTFSQARLLLQQTDDVALRFRAFRLATTVANSAVEHPIYWSKFRWRRCCGRRPKRRLFARLFSNTPARPACTGDCSRAILMDFKRTLNSLLCNCLTV